MSCLFQRHCFVMRFLFTQFVNNEPRPNPRTSPYDSCQSSVALAHHFRRRQRKQFNANASLLVHEYSARPPLTKLEPHDP